MAKTVIAMGTIDDSIFSKAVELGIFAKDYLSPGLIFSVHSSPLPGIDLTLFDDVFVQETALPFIRATLILSARAKKGENVDSYAIQGAPCDRCGKRTRLFELTADRDAQLLCPACLRGGGGPPGDPAEKVASYITLYTTPSCPRCHVIRDALDRAKAVYEVKDMTDPAVLTDLRVAGIVVAAAPVLRVGDNLYTVDALFSGDDELRVDVGTLIGGPI